MAINVSSAVVRTDLSLCESLIKTARKDPWWKNGWEKKAQLFLLRKVDKKISAKQSLIRKVYLIILLLQRFYMFIIQLQSR